MAQASTALLSPPARSVAPTRSERALRVRADEATVEVAARRSEELEQARNLRPLIDRLFLFAMDSGPAAFQTVAAVERWSKRHAARWSE